MESGFYWVKLHPSFEQVWVVAYYSDIKKEWYLHNIEGDCSASINIITSRIDNPDESFM